MKGHAYESCLKSVSCKVSFMHNLVANVKKIGIFFLLFILMASKNDTTSLADRGGGGGGDSGGSNPPLKNNVKGFNPKYKIIS